MDKKIELYNRIMNVGRQAANLQSDFMILCLIYQEKYGQKELEKLMADFEKE